MKEKILTLFDSALKLKSKKGIDHLLLHAKLHTERGVSIFEGKVNSVEIADQIKIGVWAGVNGAWGGSSFEKVDAASLDRALEQAKISARYSDFDAAFSLAPKKETTIPPVDLSKITLTLPELEKLALQLEKNAKNSSNEIKNIPYAGVGFESTIHVVANSEGVNLAEENGSLATSLSILAQGSDDRVVRYSDTSFFSDKKNYEPNVFISRIVAEALKRRNPETAPTGSLPILLDASSTNHLLSDFWSIFSGELLYQKLTRLEGKLNKPIASSILSLHDSCTQGLTLRHFDAEGTLAWSKPVIENGIFKNFLHNRYTAQKVGSQSTGNATGGAGGPPSISPMNLILGGITTPVDSILQKIKNGIYIVELTGASSSAVSGDFSYGALGYWIENGKIGTPLADFTVAGNIFDVLMKVEAIGDDLYFEGPHSMGSYGGRSLLLSSLEISGK